MTNQLFSFFRDLATKIAHGASKTRIYWPSGPVRKKFYVGHWEQSSHIMVGPNLSSENEYPSMLALSNTNDSHLLQS